MIFILGGLRGAGLTRGGARAHPRGDGTVIEGGFLLSDLEIFFGLFFRGSKEGTFLRNFFKNFSKIFSKFFFFLSSR